MSTTSEDALKAEIARLTGKQNMDILCVVAYCCFIGAINRHKAGAPSKPYYAARNNTYVNPNYKPPSKPASTSRPLPSAKSYTQTAVASASVARPPMVTNQPPEVVIDGVAFKSSGRALVRKDRALQTLLYEIMEIGGFIDVAAFTVAASTPASNPPFIPTSSRYPRTYQGTRSTQRTYKPTSSRRMPRNQNMTLTNGRKPMRLVISLECD